MDWPPKIIEGVEFEGDPRRYSMNELTYAVLLKKERDSERLGSRIGSVIAYGFMAVVWLSVLVPFLWFTILSERGRAWEWAVVKGRTRSTNAS